MEKKIYNITTDSDLKDIYTAAMNIYGVNSIVNITKLEDGSVIYENENAKVTVSSNMLPEFSSYYLEIRNINLNTELDPLSDDRLNPSVIE